MCKCSSRLGCHSCRCRPRWLNKLAPLGTAACRGGMCDVGATQAVRTACRDVERVGSPWEVLNEASDKGRLKDENKANKVESSLNSSQATNSFAWTNIIRMLDSQERHQAIYFSVLQRCWLLGTQIQRLTVLNHCAGRLLATVGGAAPNSISACATLLEQKDKIVCTDIKSVQWAPHEIAFQSPSR